MYGLACCHHGNILTLVDNNSSVYSSQHQSTIDTPLQPYTTVDNIISVFIILLRISGIRNEQAANIIRVTADVTKHVSSSAYRVHLRVSVK